MYSREVKMKRENKKLIKDILRLSLSPEREVEGEASELKIK